MAASQAMIDYTNAEFILNARKIYEARADPGQRSPFVNHPAIYGNLLPEIQAFVDAYERPGPPVNLQSFSDRRIILTPFSDISMFGGAPRTHLSRDGANGNSLRAMAMFYKPTGLYLVLHLPADMSDAMYSFYGNSSLVITTHGNYRIYLNRFHPDVSSLFITSSYPGAIESLDPIVDRMVNYPDQSFNFIFETTGNNCNTTSIRPASASSTRRTIRTLLMTTLNVMQTSTNPGLRIYLQFCLGDDPQRNDNDPHTYLQNLAGQTQGMNYTMAGRASIIDKPANLNIPRRRLRFGYDEVGGVNVRGCTRVSLSVNRL